MPRYYKKILVATETKAVMDALRTLEGRFIGGVLPPAYTIWLALRCYDREVGPPISGGRGTRWFTEKYSPDQMWLPFKYFEPVKLEGVYGNLHSQFGEGYILVYQESDGCDREIYFNINQTYEPSRLVALVAFRKYAKTPSRAPHLRARHRTAPHHRGLDYDEID